MWRKRIQLLCLAAILPLYIILLGGCTTPPPLTLDGQTIPKGTPIAIRGGPITEEEYLDAQLLLEAYGFSVRKDDRPNPSYVFDIIFRSIPDHLWYCRLTLLRDGEPVVSVNGQFAENPIWAHDDSARSQPGPDAESKSMRAHAKLFEEVLQNFKKSLDGH
jgi:hypothetical protein